MENKTTPRRARLSVEQKQKVMSQWLASGKSANAFAREAGLGSSTLYKWRRKWGPAARKPDAAPPFIPVHIGKPASPGSVQVRGTGGLVVNVDSKTDEVALVRALRAITQCG